MRVGGKLKQTAESNSTRSNHVPVNKSGNLIDLHHCLIGTNIEDTVQTPLLLSSFIDAVSYGARRQSGLINNPKQMVNTSTALIKCGQLERNPSDSNQSQGLEGGQRPSRFTKQPQSFESGTRR